MAQGDPFFGGVHALIWPRVWLFALAAQISCPANPIGGVVVDGNALIQNTAPGLTTIVQQSSRAVIDWHSFSIASGERTNFIVPDVTSATLNRVLDCGPSILNGTLTSNGQLFLINSNGIIFGKCATVDVAGLTASTLNIDNCAFMAGGDLVFKGHSDAKVTNEGVITASSGDVFLIGYQVSNEGTIRAPNGTVGLAAGSEVLIRAMGEERVVVRSARGPKAKTGVSNSGLIEASVAELKARDGNVYAMAIRNTGRISATGVTREGGRILLTANGGKIENRGTLVARSTSGNGGQIKVNAGNSGKVTISGRVDADGPDGVGGQISINGEHIEIRRAVAVSADGAIEGGQIEIGSNAPADSYKAGASETVIEGIVSANSTRGNGGQIYLGGRTISIRSDALISVNGSGGGGRIDAGIGAGSGLVAAAHVTIDCGALISANAMENGTGGQIVVMSENELIFQGSLQARGGDWSGDGGQATLSAGESLIIDRLAGRVSLTANQGSAGSLWVQSSEWMITSSESWANGEKPANTLAASDLSCFLNTANLTVQTRIGASGSGNVYAGGRIAWNSANDLTIRADCDVLLLCEDWSPGVIDSRGGGDVTISAARFVMMDSSTAINTTSGNVVIDANQRVGSNAGQFGITVGGGITTEGGNVSLTGVGVASMGGAVNAGNGTILVDGNDGAINLAGALMTTNGTAAAVRIIDATTASLGAISTGAAGSVVLGEAEGDNLSGSVTQTGAIHAGTVVGNTGNSVTLNGNNSVSNLGAFTSTGAFVFNDTMDGLNVTGNVETRGGAATVSTAGGLLALGNSSITTAGGDVSLTGVGVTSTGGTVDAGGGTISVDGNDGAINLAGSLKTTNETAKAVRIVDATTASLGDITTGVQGSVVLGEAGGDNLSGEVTQTGRINAGTLTGDTGSTVTLDGNNTVVNLGELTSTDAFVFRDTTDGLNVTGDVATRGGAVTVSTAGGALALGNSSITTEGGDVSLTGAGVTSAGGTVDAGGGAISVDGNDGAIALAGSLKTTNETAKAVSIVDATTVSVGNITTGTEGRVALGGAAGDKLSGAVTQTGSLKAGSVILSGDGSFSLAGASNAINTVATAGAVGSVSLVNSKSLNVGTVGTASGLSAIGDIAVSVTGGNGLLISNDVASQGGAVSLSASSVEVDGSTVSSSGGAAVTLTANQFLLSNQSIVRGVMVGTGGNAQITLDDANLTQAGNYLIEAGKVTTGTRSYAFQNVAALRLDLGSGDDKADTNFFTFSQDLSAGAGTNQLLLAGKPVTSSPLTRPGYGTISFTGFKVAPPPSPPSVNVPPLGALALQNATPGSGGSGSSGSQTNNFNSAGASGGSLGLAGGAGMSAGGAAAIAAGVSVAANVANSIGQGLGIVSAGGGAPPSLGLQSQMDATTSPQTQSELSRALGGDGTMGVRSSTGLVSVDPGSGPPSSSSLAQLGAGISLLAQSELSFGAIGTSEVPLTSLAGAVSLNLAEPPPNDALKQIITQAANPQAYSTLSAALGGDGTAHVDSTAGGINIDLNGRVLPTLPQISLAANVSPGAIAELSVALGGSGEFIVNDSYGLAIMDPSGAPPGQNVRSALGASLKSSAYSELMLVLGGDGVGLVVPRDGIVAIAFDETSPDLRIMALLDEGTNQQSAEELDAATR